MLKNILVLNPISSRISSYVSPSNGLNGFDILFIFEEMVDTAKPDMYSKRFTGFGSEAALVNRLQ
jgi:hypothetical protein